MPIPKQYDLFGGTACPPNLSPAEKVAYLLDSEPDTRNDDRLLMLRYWTEFDGLASILSEEALAALTDWFQKVATHPETIRRRRADHQKLSTEAGHLRPDEATIAYRRSRDGAGPPRR